MVEFKVGDRVSIRDGVEWNAGSNAGAWDGATITEKPREGGKLYGAQNVSGEVGLLFIDEMQPYRAAPPIPADIAERAMALIRQVADGLTSTTVVTTARAIIDALKPVDPDLLAARELVECTVHWSPQTDHDIQSGKNDDTPEMKIAIAAIAKGRELEREGK